MVFKGRRRLLRDVHLRMAGAAVLAAAYRAVLAVDARCVSRDDRARLWHVAYVRKASDVEAQPVRKKTAQDGIRSQSAAWPTGLRSFINGELFHGCKPRRSRRFHL